jgi:hypothetical protein
MNKSKARKSRAAKSVRNLPVKTLNAKSAKGVRGGGGDVEKKKKEYLVVKMQDVIITNVTPGGK